MSSFAQAVSSMKLDDSPRNFIAWLKDCVRGSPTAYAMLNGRQYNLDISFCPQTPGGDVLENIQSDNCQAETSLLEKETLVHLYADTLT